MAVKLVAEYKLRSYTVRLLSRIESTNKVRTDHPAIRRLLHDINDLNSEAKSVQFSWIPDHGGIHGKEMADQRAVAAATRPEEYITTYYKDWYPIIRARIADYWNRQWKEKKQVKDKVGPWRKIRKITRKAKR